MSVYRFKMRALCHFVLFAVQFLCLVNGDALDDLNWDMHPRILSPARRLRIAQKSPLGTAENTAEYWNKMAKKTVRRHKRRKLMDSMAKNVIFFLGDGMSVATITAARIQQGQMKGCPGEESRLSFEDFPVTGFSKTYCVDNQVPDSACTSTAYLGGVKANFMTIGVTAEVKLGDCIAAQNTSNHVDSILKKALDMGKEAGIVTTTRVTHASPAGGYAHVAYRGWENDGAIEDDGVDSNTCFDIADQLIYGDPGYRFKVILGGGRSQFLPNTKIDEENVPGLRRDGRNLIEEWKQIRESQYQNYEYVWNRDQLLNVKDNTEYLMGLFEGSHCKFNLNTNKETEPTLTEMVNAAINLLSKNEEGYILFVEGGRIDHGHHASMPHLALDEAIEFSKAVKHAVKNTNPKDTLILVTSDHSHSMSETGYPSRGNPIFGYDDYNNAADGLPYTSLTYANGPGYRQLINGHRPVFTDEEMSQKSFRFPSVAPLNSATHAAEDVAVFAKGPQQYMFTGSYEQNTIPHLISYAMCLDDDFSYCTENDINTI